MIKVAIHDETLETPFRDICEAELPLTATEEDITKMVRDLLMMHKRLKSGETAVQKEYNDL